VARPQEFVEADVIAAARDHFWTHGYAGTSLDDLTAEAQRDGDINPAADADGLEQAVVILPAPRWPSNGVY
jgi:hypothetical protein